MLIGRMDKRIELQAYTETSGVSAFGIGPMFVKAGEYNGGQEHLK